MVGAMRLLMTSGQRRIYGNYIFTKGLIIMDIHTAIPASKKVVNAVLCSLLLRVPKPTFTRTKVAKMRMKSYGII